MKTYILKETLLDNYYDFAIKNTSCIDEAKIKIAMMGLEELDIESAKKIAEIGDCLLLEYDGKMLPFQIIHKYADGRCVLSSYYVLDNHIFDEKTNVWRDSSIRKYMNEDMAKKFDPELIRCVKEKDVHTDDYVTKDKFWLLSHEEIGYDDKNNMFRKNIGTETFDYYKNTASDDKIVA